MTGALSYYAGERDGMTVVVAGCSPTSVRDLADMAFILATYAMTLGFEHVRLNQSRVRWSMSKYIRFSDAKGQLWNIRLSDHHRGIRKRYVHDLPHLDLVSRDGRSGMEAVKAFMEDVARGAREWADLTAPPPPPAPKPAESPLAWRERE